MSINSDGWTGIIWAVLLIGGGIYLWERNKTPEETPPIIETVPSAPNKQRPSGRILFTRFDNGTVWNLDADTVIGPREARQAWVIADHRADKTVSKRETKTLYRVNCETTAYRTLSIVEYDSEGKSLNSWKEADFSAEADYPPPGSNIAAVIDIACDEAFSLPESKQPPPITIPSGSG